MRVLLLSNAPVLSSDHPDFASEAGVDDSLQAFAVALRAHGHEFRSLALGSSVQPLLTVVDDFRPEVLVNFCESFAGRVEAESYLAGFLELLPVPYTGSSPETLALVRRKDRTKWLLQGAGLPTAKFWLVPKSNPLPEAELRAALDQGALFVKPAGEDASLGISDSSVVESYERLIAQVAEVRDRYGDVLIERYIDGREFNIAIIALPEIEILPLAEIRFADLPWPIVTYDAKWTPGTPGFEGTPVDCPAQLSPELADRIRETARAAFELTGCRDYARVDLRVDRSDQVFVLEVNPNPDLSPDAGFARALRAAGIDYADFVERLISVAAARRPCA